MTGGRRAPCVVGILTVLLLLVSGTRSQDCGALITTEGELVGNNLIIETPNVKELTAEGATLLTVNWLPDTFNKPEQVSTIDTALGETHLATDVDEGTQEIVVSVKLSMEGLSDYPQSETALRLVYTFPLLEVGDISECTVTMLFDLVDQNTATPTTDAADYTASVREDFPEQLTIPNLLVIAGDLDGGAPNNQLSVAMDPTCPLETEEASYSPVNGTIPITFVLKTKLDFDTMENPVVVCAATLKDGGTDPNQLSADFTVTVNVLAFDDEPPVFEEPYYYCTLETMEAPSAALNVQPGTLAASDPDKPPQPVTYSMAILSDEDAQWEAFFRVDADSGEVFQEQDLTEDLLQDANSVHFVVTATDSSGATDTTVLEIILPPAPTTTSTTTTTTTTTPTPTTSTTTPTTTTTTTPTTTTTTPTTTTTTEPPTPTTCTPCETTVTTSSTTWTTAGLVTTTSTTTSTATEGSTSEAATCAPCTTEITTCPSVPTTTEGGTQPSDSTETSSSSVASMISTSTDITTMSPSAATTEAVSSTTCPPCSSVTPDHTSSSSSAFPSTTPTNTPTTTFPPTSSSNSPTPQPGSTSSPEGSCPTCSPCDCSSTASDSTTTTSIPVTGSTTTGPLTSSSSSGAPGTGSTSTGTTTGDPGDSTPSSAATTPPVTTDGSLPPSTAGPSTTEPPTNPQYKFQLQAYHFQPFTDSTTVGTLVVLPVEGPPVQPEGIVFSWDPDSSEGSDNFLLAGSTGTISLATTEQTPGSYSLVAVAEVDGQMITTEVFITLISPLKCDDMFVSPGVLMREVSEYDEPNMSIAKIVVNTESLEEVQYCFSVTPTKLEDRFSVNTDGEVLLAAAIDADTSPENISIRVLATSDSEPCAVPTGGELSRSEALILIKIQDENDEPPEILSPVEGGLLGYPSNRGLQQVVGPVTQLQVQDPDEATVLHFGVTGSGSDLFLVDSVTGELFLSDSDACDTQCEVTVTVSDGEHDVQRTLQVHRLDITHIHDLSVGNRSTIKVEQYLESLSNDTGLDLHLLYTSLASGGASSRVQASDVFAGGRAVSQHSSRVQNSRSGRARDDDDEGEWSTVAHIYGFDDAGQLITLQTLNSALSDAEGDMQAAEFSEKETFVPAAPDDPSIVGYQVAVGVLGGLLGLLLVAAVVGYVMFSKKQQKRDHRSKNGGPVGVSTIGGAYPNHSYEDTELHYMDSDSTKSSNDGSNKKQETELFPGTTDVVNTDSTPYDAVATDVAPSTVTFGAGGASSTYDSREAPPERKSSQHSLSGLRRIDPGPAPDGLKSSPYLSSSEGDFTTSRPSDKDKVPSFTAYKGASSDSADFAAPYSPVYKSSGYSSSHGNDKGRREDRAKESRDPAKQMKISDPSPYAFPVKTKKEPPNLSSAAPSKPIMKPNKENGTVSTSAEVHNTADATPNSSAYSKLRGSPPPKGKKKDDNDEKKSNLKANLSDSETTDSERKKSVAFKVLVDQKEIKRREEIEEEKEETEDL